jgi:hypothetical protein
MDDSIATKILGTASSTLANTSGIVEYTGFSPNTVVRYLRELESRGLITRTKESRVARGRPSLIVQSTELGDRYFAESVRAQFTRIHNEFGAVWGPSQSFSHWGVPLFGRWDVFSKAPIQDSPFEVVRSSITDLYTDTVRSPEGDYPSREALTKWAILSRVPMQVAAAATLLGEGQFDKTRFVADAEKAGFQNRLGYLVEATGTMRVWPSIARATAWEKMTRRRFPLDHSTRLLSEKWHIKNPLAVRQIAKMQSMYSSG